MPPIISKKLFVEHTTFKNRRYQSLVGGYHDYMRGDSVGHIIINRMWVKVKLTKTIKSNQTKPKPKP